MNSRYISLIVAVLVLTFGWASSAPIGDDDSRNTIVTESTTELPLVTSSTIQLQLRSGIRESNYTTLITERPERGITTSGSGVEDDRTRSPGLQSADYILSDAEYQTILEQLQQEAENDVASNMRNYAGDDESVDDIMRRIEAIEREQQQQQQQQQPSEVTIQGSIREENGEQLIGDQPSQRSLNRSDSLRTNQEECPICLTPIEQLSEAPVIPCGHKFHRTCLHTWENYQMSSSSKCPICRQYFAL